MPHSWTCALPFLFNLDDASGFELAQSTPSRVLSQAGGSQSRTPKQDWVLATLRKDLAQLSKRTKEDDGAFVKDILKLNHRMDQFEKQLKKMKAVHA